MPTQSIITTFPNELLDRIFVHLTDKKELASVSRVYRSFKDPAQRMLFRDVCLPAQYLEKLRPAAYALRTVNRMAKASVQHIHLRYIDRCGCQTARSLPEFSEGYKPKEARYSANLATAITTSPHLGDYVETLRLELALVTKVSSGNFVLDKAAITSLLSKLKRLRELVIVIVEQPLRYVQRSKVALGLSDM